MKQLILFSRKKELYTEKYIEQELRFSQKINLRSPSKYRLVTVMDETNNLPAKNEKISLIKFVGRLIETGDFSKLGAEALATLLALNYYFYEKSNGEEKFPDLDSLIELCGIDQDILEIGLTSLYKNGYLNKVSYFKDGNSYDAYKIRSKEWLISEDGDIDGEISWDVNFTSNPIGINELKNILIAKNIGDARVIHIENLQVNLNASDTNKESNVVDYDDRAKAIEKEDAKELEKPIKKISEQLSVEHTAKRHPDPDLKLASVNSDFEMGRPDSKPLSSLYQTYVDRLFHDFTLALESSDKLIANALKEKHLHDEQEPSKPIGLALIFKSNRWKMKRDQWLKSRHQLEQNYALCIEEKNRLLSALKPGMDGEHPLYIKEAIQQLKQDYPKLAEEIDSRYSLIA